MTHVGRALGLELPGTLAFDYPTIDALAAYAAPFQAQHGRKMVKPGGPYPALAPASRQPARCAPDQATLLSSAPCAVHVRYLSTHPSREEGIVAIDACVGRFSEPACGDTARDCARVTPLERWDVDSASPAVLKRPGSRFGRHVSGTHNPCMLDRCTFMTCTSVNRAAWAAAGS